MTQGHGKQVEQHGPARSRHRLLGAIVALVGAGLAVPGGYLVALGGSPYYVIAGLALGIAGAELWRGRARGAVIFLLVWLGTLLWTLWEAPGQAWQWPPRLGLLTILGLALAIGQGGSRWRRPAIAAIAVAILIAALAFTGGHDAAAPAVAHSRAAPVDGEWPHIGRSLGADRFSSLDQIGPDNVAKLKVAWTAHLGKPPAGLASTIEATPIMVGDTLYTCNASNVVTAIDPDSGRIKWTFDPKIDAAGVAMAVCRGVAYHRQPDATGACAARIFVATLDARLIAVDAADGKPCRDFGEAGAIDLLAGMGDVPKGYYYPTSPPAVIRNRLVIGGRVADGQTVNEPSGVIRAFDAMTGKLAWAWDMARPDRTGLPPAGETYTRGTPNAWAPIAGDEASGTAFVPLGNATPDYVMSHRTPAMREYSSAIVALDVETGKERWHFRTVHLDVWDYDLPSAPSLVDFPTDRGMRPALIQPTKRGQFFVLDRETGQPLVETVERPVPQGAAPGERLSPTQPYPVGMPALTGARLTEASMWGITPFDQLWCRIRFRQARYDGDFTPVGTRPTIVSPGYFGGSNWSGISIDPERGIMIANVMHLPMYNRLVPRADADPAAFRPAQVGKHAISGENWAQQGTPYAVKTVAFTSPLAIPCNQPPYSEIAAIDLHGRRVMWRKPLGSARDTGPWNIPSRLPVTIGVPTLGGTLATRSGLVFIAATQERALRAFDSQSGRLLWQDRLPAGGHANPMTYRSPRSGRQFVLIPASGHPRFANGDADALIAYALPD